MTAHDPTPQEAVRRRQEEMAEHVDHGHSTAAWAGVGTCMLGAFIASIAVVFALVWLFWVGIVVMVASAAVAKVLAGRAGSEKESDGAANRKVR